MELAHLFIVALQFTFDVMIVIAVLILGYLYFIFRGK